MQFVKQKLFIIKIDKSRLTYHMGSSIWYARRIFRKINISYARACVCVCVCKFLTCTYQMVRNISSKNFAYVLNEWFLCKKSLFQSKLITKFIDNISSNIFSLFRVLLHIFFDKRDKSTRSINLFQVTGLFLCPLKKNEKLQFSNVFWGYRKRGVA